MEILIPCLAVVLFVGSIAGSIMGNMIASELYDRAPLAACWLIEKAVARLPESQRQRYREEWYAHLAECPGKLAKLAHSLGCLYGSQQLAAAFAKPMRAYASVPREGQDDLLLKIGTTTPHADGHGFDLTLYAFPAPNVGVAIVLRQEDDENRFGKCWTSAVIFIKTSLATIIASIRKSA